MIKAIGTDKKTFRGKLWKSSNATIKGILQNISVILEDFYNHFISKQF